MRLDRWQEELPHKDQCLIQRKFQAWGPKRLARELGLTVDQVRYIARQMGLRRRAGRPAASVEANRIPLFAWDQKTRAPENAPTPEEINTRVAEIRAACIEPDPPDDERPRAANKFVRSLEGER